MIKAYDTQSVSNAMINALVAQELQRQKTMREAELENKVRDLEMELELRKQRDASIYSRLLESSEYHAEEGGAVSSILWAIIGYLVLAFGWLGDVIYGYHRRSS